MESQNLFNKVLSEDGLLCLVGLMSDRSEIPRVLYFEQGDPDIYDAVEALDKAGREVYFACATFQRKDKPKDVQNIHTLKSFFLDLDCGKEDGYQTQKEAVTALIAFCDTLKMPLPTLVSSGFGVHAYWSLDTAIDYNTWKPIAHALKRKTNELGLKADPVVTADGARILRVPSTTNKKRDNNHKKVVLRSLGEDLSLAHFSACIGYVSREAYSPVHSTDPVMEKLMQTSRTFKFSRIYRKSIDTVERIEDVVEQVQYESGAIVDRLVKKKVIRSAGCPQIAYCVANRATLEEPMWHAALSVAQFCVDRVEGIEMVSRDYPGTEPDEWFAKASRAEGPRTCEKWKELNHPQLCSTCIHKGKITSPISLGVMIEEATPEEHIVEVNHEGLNEKVTIEIPTEYPFPWIRPKGGGVAYRGSADQEESGDDDDDPDEFMVYERDLWVKDRAKDGEQEYATICIRLPNDGLCEETAPLTHLFKPETLRDILAKRGVHVVTNNKRLELLRKYIGAWIKKLQDDGKATNARKQFGWHDNDTRFVIGSREIDDAGNISHSPITKNAQSVADVYAKVGALEEWQKVVNTYAYPGNEARAFALFCGFGAPLYKFVGEGSMIVHLTNVASGVGKSTLQKASTSIWGNPVRGMLTDNDTVNAKLHRAGILKNLPVCFDEVTNMLPEAVSRFAFDLSSGRGKNRLKTHDNMERANDSTWETIFQTSGNNSLHSVLQQHKAAVEGEMLRILEVPVSKDDKLTKAQADELFGQILPYNYGVACEPYMQYVVPNVENVKGKLLETRRKFDEVVNSEGKERFYSGCIAAAFAGGEIANRLGIIDIPIEPVWKWAIELFGETRETVKKASFVVEGESHASVVSKYWNEVIAQILVVQTGQTAVDEVLLNQSVSKPVIGALKGRHEVRNRRLYVSCSDFASWMAAKRMPNAQIMHGLRASQTLLEEKMMNLGEGTANYSTAPVSVYVFDVNKLNGISDAGLTAVG